MKTVSPVPFRPSAVPLITCDPYFSVWSFADALTDDHTRHWTGRRQGMCGLVRVDGTAYRFLGSVEPDDNRYFTEPEALRQTSLLVTPTATKVSMENGLLSLSLEFRTPLLLDRPELFSRPVSYLTYSVSFKDGGTHDFAFYFDVTPECTVTGMGQTVVYSKTDVGFCCGREEQKPLNRSGDDLTIDWGFLHLAHPDARLSGIAGRKKFSGCRRPGNTDYATDRPNPASAFVTLAVETGKTEGTITLAYDDGGKSIRYFDEELPSYYLSLGGTFSSMLTDAVQNAGTYRAMAEEFDRTMTAEMKEIGEDYAEVGALVYRQAIAAHKLVKSERDGLLFLSKECFSNGCIATLDVTYPSIPLFLRYNPSLVKGMMAPIFRFASTPAWKFPFAPHDCGQYPLCTGQVYGLDRATGELRYEQQMPVEECGNAILTVAAVCRAEGSAAYAEEHRELLTLWADYLAEHGYNPENQLCTDDFAGHLAQNCNLSAKAIVALAALGDLLGIGSYRDTAREMAKRWQKDAKAATGTRLTFDGEDGWSLKYNLVWDRLLGLHLFPDSLYREELATYRAHSNPYGVPLDSRRGYTKLDWELWTTALCDDPDYRAEVTRAVWRAVSETRDRVPVSDWYETGDARQVGFQNRTVLGGFFIPQLKPR